MALLVGLDAAMGGATVITTAYALAPFGAALYGGRWSTLLTAVLAVAFAVISPLWNGDFGGEDYVVRLAIVGLASVVAVFAAWLQAESRRSMRRFSVLNDLTALADGSLALADAMRLISDLIVPELADFCMIDLVADGSVERVAVRASGPAQAEVEGRLTARAPTLPENLVGETEPGSLPEPRFWSRVGDEDLRGIAHDEEDLEFLRGLGVSSAITVGLVSRGRRVGALTVCMAWSRRHYTREDLRFVQVLADRAALALDNTGLFADLQSVERRMDSVMAVLEEAVVIHARSKRIVFANQAAADLFGFATPEDLIAGPAKIRDLYELYDESGSPLDPEQQTAMRALRGESAGPEIVRAISRRDGAEIWLRARSRTVQGMDGQPLYAVTSFEDVTDIKEAEFEQTLLARLGELFGSAFDHKVMAERLAQLLIPQLADCCVVFAAAPEGTLEELAVAHTDPTKAERVRALVAEFPVRLDTDPDPAGPIVSQAATLSEDLDGLLRAGSRQGGEPRIHEASAMGSAMLVPMRIGGRMTAALLLINEQDRRPFDDFDRALGEKVAERATAALESARLASERSEIAETLQRGLLPPPIPDIPGWSVAALYRPAGAENEVGGDFYDAFRFAGGWILVVGDVTGRGARAASITALARYTLRTASAITGDPLAAISALNRALLAREDPALCTVAAMAIREKTNEVRIAVAGHPPPLIVDGGTVREAIGSGPVLGAFPDCDWQLEETRLEAGQSLVVYTDGITEAAGPNGRFGEDRLRDRLLGVSSPGMAVQRIEQALLSFCEGDLQDDAAIVAIGPGDARLLDDELARLVDTARD